MPFLETFLYENEILRHFLRLDTCVIVYRIENERKIKEKKTFLNMQMSLFARGDNFRMSSLSLAGERETTRAENCKNYIKKTKLH